MSSSGSSFGVANCDIIIVTSGVVIRLEFLKWSSAISGKTDIPRPPNLVGKLYRSRSLFGIVVPNNVGRKVFARKSSIGCRYVEMLGIVLMK